MAGDVRPVGGGGNGQRFRTVAVQAVGARRSNRNQRLQGLGQSMAQQSFGHGAAADVAGADHQY